MKYCFVAVLVLLISCSPPVAITSSWKSPEVVPSEKKVKTLYISALSGSPAAKAIVEGEMSIAAQERGYKVIKSVDLYPPEFTSTLPAKEDVIKKIKELGCEAIVTNALVDKESETRYVPGSFSISYAPYGGAYPYYGTYGSYYSYWGGATYTTPGYYATDKTYFLETNIYDINTERLMWSAQSKTVNPSGLQKFSVDYTKAIILQLEKDGILKRQ